MDAKRLRVINQGFEPLWKADEVAAYLNVPISAVHRARKTEGLPALRVGGTFRFQPSSVRAWVAEREALMEGPEEASTVIVKARPRVELIA